MGHRRGPAIIEIFLCGAFLVKKQGRALCYRTTRLFGLALVEKETVGYAAIDAAHAKKQLLITEGLIAGSIRTSLPFITHNKSIFSEAADIEAKLRRADLIKSPR